MALPVTFFARDQNGWRRWLARNGRTKNEVWLIFHKKHFKKKCVAYGVAVEEALCFGWIDSIVRKLDEHRYIQRFSPRKPGSKWSSSNLARIKKLIAAGRVSPEGLAAYRGRHRDRPAADKLRKVPLRVPPTFTRLLRGDKRAREHWAAFTPGYRRLYLTWIRSAKKKETRLRRMKEAVSLIARNVKHLLK